jgi:hypothetical protein
MDTIIECEKLHHVLGEDYIDVVCTMYRLGDTHVAVEPQDLREYQM